MDLGLVGGSLCSGSCTCCTQRQRGLGGGQGATPGVTKTSPRGGRGHGGVVGGEMEELLEQCSGFGVQASQTRPYRETSLPLEMGEDFKATSK